MEIEEPFKTGFLFTPPQSFLRKSWAKRFCALYNASIHGIQRLEVFDSDNAFLQSKSPTKIIPLTDCVKVTPAPQKQQANVFEVRTKTCCNQFSADSFQEMTEWLGALRTVAFGSIRPSSGLSGLFNSPDVKQEENLLYCSVHEPEVYNVRSLNTEAMIRNNLCGEYKLVITASSISVTEMSSSKVGKTLLTWPFRHIRRYGCSKDNFSFEAGRKCVSGEGLFAFSTLDGRAIFESVDSHVSLLKSSQNDSDAPASPFPDADKNFFTYKEDSEKHAVGHVVGSSYNILTSQDENLIKLENEGSKFEKVSNKIGLPVSKPPRKSKQNSETSAHSENEDGKLSIKPTSKLSSKFQPNMYDDAESASSRSCSRHEKFHCDDALHETLSETKTFSSLESNTEIPQEIPEPVYAVLEENAFNMSDIVHQLEHSHGEYENVSNSSFQSCSDIPISSHHPRRESDCYDHFSLRKHENSRHFLQNSTSDHVYGKLITTRPSSSGPRSNYDNPYGSLNIKKREHEGAVSDVTHSYSNVQPKSPPHSSGVSESTTSEPKHFLRNNAEYAKVFKNRK